MTLRAYGTLVGVVGAASLLVMEYLRNSLEDKVSLFTYTWPLYITFALMMLVGLYIRRKTSSD